MSQVNEKIVGAVSDVNRYVVGPGQVLPEGTSVAQQVGRGMAYDLVAQSTAIAIQDAADHMRNVAMITQAALAAVTTKMMERPDEASSKWGSVVKELQGIAEAGVSHFQKVGEQASKVAQEYPAA